MSTIDIEQRIAMIWFGIKLESEKSHKNPEINKLRVLLKESKTLERELNISSHIIKKHSKSWIWIFSESWPSESTILTPRPDSKMKDIVHKIKSLPKIWWNFSP